MMCWAVHHKKACCCVGLYTVLIDYHHQYHHSYMRLSVNGAFMHQNCITIKTPFSTIGIHKFTYNVSFCLLDGKEHILKHCS